jgi:hypothetical protein
MSEHLPTNDESLDDQLQAVLEQGGQSVRDLLDRVALDSPEELREAVRFCEQHMTGSNQVRSVYLTNAEGHVTPLDAVTSLSIGDIETVGYEDDGSLYLQLKGLE